MNNLLQCCDLSFRLIDTSGLAKEEIVKESLENAHSIFKQLVPLFSNFKNKEVIVQDQIEEEDNTPYRILKSKKNALRKNLILSLVIVVLNTISRWRAS